MPFKLSTTTKILLVLVAFAVAIYGFMLKLPSGFRRHDKELHSAFYFLAAAFLNILFAKRNIIIHAILFAGLYAFGVAIEYAQEYSNKLLHKRIHGRFDIEDVYANVRGLVLFSVLWIVCVLAFWLYKQVRVRAVKE
jgi:hypothetical protein